MTTEPAFPFRIASAEHALRHVFVRDLVLEATIGVHRHEKRQRQPIRINVDLTVCEGKGAIEDRLADVVDYERLVDGIRALVASGHVNLVETLAERIAAQCLEDTRVLAVRVRVEKLAAVPDAASVGVEIERVRTP
jgi:7,8-dihydroneopterin aldolase/epimerase/oxygenase